MFDNSIVSILRYHHGQHFICILHSTVIFNIVCFVEV